MVSTWSESCELAILKVIGKLFKTVNMKDKSIYYQSVQGYYYL